MSTFPIASLLRPAAYPHPVANMTLMETHLSWAVLTGEYVYKVKKPVALPFADFSDLEKREHYCREELRLNSLYSPDIYLDVVAVRNDGTLHIGGKGSIVEYALRMRQLPQSARLDVMLGDGRACAEMFICLADLIHGFHRGAAVVGDRAFASPRAIRDHFSGFEAMMPIVSEELGAGFMFAQLLAGCFRFIHHHRDILETRQREGYVRECHGDLHLSNIFFTDRAHVTDCIEFNDAYRRIDVAQDVAFLAMDLEVHGHRDYADAYVRRYAACSGDATLELLLPFYKCWTSTVRSMVLLMSAREKPAGGERMRFLRASRRYLGFAHDYTRVLSR